MYDWGEPQRFKFCVIFRGKMGFVYRLARTTFLSQPVFIFNSKTSNKSVFFARNFDRNTIEKLLQIDKNRLNKLYLGIQQIIFEKIGAG